MLPSGRSDGHMLCQGEASALREGSATQLGHRPSVCVQFVRL
jgi:hypothetical protein